MDAAEPLAHTIAIEADRVVLSVSSDIDIASIAEFRAALDEATAPGKPIVIDLSTCNYLDSTGISTLVSAHNANITMSVIASRHVARLLEIVGLSALLNVTPATP